MATPHRDRFDQVDDAPDRVGAHRAPRSAAHGWAVFGVALLAAAILAGAGVLALGALDPRYAISLPGSASTRAAAERTDSTPAPTASPAGLSGTAASVQLLDSTKNTSVEKQVKAKLGAAGWKVGASGDLSGDPLGTTMVYYSDSSMEGYALGVVGLLGHGTAILSDAYPGAGLTVVIGSDLSGS